MPTRWRNPAESLPMNTFIVFFEVTELNDFIVLRGRRDFSIPRSFRPREVQIPLYCHIRVERNGFGEIADMLAGFDGISKES
jgi:hypothetical protein